MDINDLIGIPFKEGGRTIEAFDCWGLSRIALKELYGIEIKEFSDLVCEGSELAHVIVGASRSAKWEEIGEPIGGSLAIMFDRELTPGHIGVCISHDKILHTFASTVSRIGQSIVTPLRSINRIYPRTEFYRYVS